MKKILQLSIFIVVTLLISNNIYSQTFEAEWLCDYATWDEETNGTGLNVVSVATIKPNTFVALVNRTSRSCYYLVGYTNADSANGRMGYYPYNATNLKTPWTEGFDFIEMYEAVDIAAGKDSLIFVPNNDPYRNILVFKMSADSIITSPYRLATGLDSLWAIDIDASGRVFVTVPGISGAPGKVVVYNSVYNDPNWSDINHTSSPLITFNVPDAGSLRGIAVDPTGQVIYVSNYTAKKVYCYIGNPFSGYQLYNGFNLNFSDEKIANTGDTIRPGPIGLKFMPSKNILMMAADEMFFGNYRYQYGKVFFINPNTGAYLDTIDCAEWNFAMTGGYQNRAGGTVPGNASGYTSTYNVDVDDNYSIYTQSFYGWTVDKWTYQGTLPVIPFTLIGIKKDDTSIPNGFTLEQNYPNPFNPNTTIRFELSEKSIITLSIYDISGALVGELISSSEFDRGAYTITFDASKLASGTYVYNLTDGKNSISRKMTLIK